MIVMAMIVIVAKEVAVAVDISYDGPEFLLDLRNTDTHTLHYGGIEWEKRTKNAKYRVFLIIWVSFYVFLYDL